MIPRGLLPALALLAPLAPAQQHVCEGNHQAPLSIAVSPAYLGGTLEIDLGAPTAPGGVVLLAKATAVGPVFHPLIGSIGVQVGGSSAPSPRGGHVLVQLFDGSFLVVGGMHGSPTTPVGTWALADAFIYAP